MQLKFTFRCSHCGNDSIAIPDEPADGTMITCNRCGAVLCSIDHLNERIKEAAGEAAAEHLRNVLNNVVKEPTVIELDL